MSKILYITSSPNGSGSYSTRVAAKLLEDARSRDKDVQVVHRDLAAAPLPHIDHEFIAATRGGEGPGNAHQRDLLKISDELIDELKTADVVVIAAAMVNFTIPSTLKAWIDFVARPGLTFSYGPEGPQGLVTDKQVVLVVARGGVYSGAQAAMDFQLPYLRKVLGFMGMTDIEVIEVEGTAFGQEAAERAVATATQKLTATCAQRAAA